MPKTLAPWMVKRQLLVKAESKTDPKYGCRPEERPAKDYIRFGVINLDKPAGPTSHEVAAWVKHIVGVEYVGHGGTLECPQDDDLGRSHRDRRPSNNSRRVEENRASPTFEW